MVEGFACKMNIKGDFGHPHEGESNQIEHGR